jgi:hypothetical protein
MDDVRTGLHDDRAVSVTGSEPSMSDIRTGMVLMWALLRSLLLLLLSLLLLRLLTLLHLSHLPLPHLLGISLRLCLTWRTGSCNGRNSLRGGSHDGGTHGCLLLPGSLLLSANVVAIANENIVRAIRACAVGHLCYVRCVAVGLNSRGMLCLFVDLGADRGRRSSDTSSSIHSVLPSFETLQGISLLLMLSLLLALHLHLLRCKLSQLLIGQIRVAGAQLVFELYDLRNVSG